MSKTPTTDLEFGGELFLDDSGDHGIGPLPLRAEIYRADDNEIAVLVNQVNTENERECVLTLYLTDAEATRVAQMLGAVVLRLEP